MVLAKFRKFSLFLGISIVLLGVLLLSHPLKSASPTPPSRSEVCAVVMSMPSAKNTDQMLSLLKTSRSQVVKDLIALKSNMEQYDAEGYGWQNAINSSSSLDPHPDAWLIGALRIACES
jgi:hypothetical protein